MANVSIDVLEPKKSLIDLEGNSSGDFGLTDEYTLSFIFDDIILVEFIDEVDDNSGSAILRNGIYIPTNAVNKAWRKAKAVLVGPNVKYVKVDDIVMFPNDKGVTVSNIEIEGYGKVRKGMFLNEQRLFGICKRK
jgi:cellobiose-specific phosphotransferase system component IIB